MFGWDVYLLKSHYRLFHFEVIHFYTYVLTNHPQLYSYFCNLQTRVVKSYIKKILEYVEEGMEDEQQ